MKAYYGTGDSSAICSNRAIIRRVARILRAGAYDFRASFPTEAGPQEARLLGCAIGKFVEGPFLVGRDTRRESKQFSLALVQGLIQTAESVFDLGIIPTPIAGFAARRTGSVSLVVSPSHNALGYVGLKGFTSQGLLWGSEWTRLRKALVTNGFASSFKSGASSLQPRKSMACKGRFRLKRRYLKYLSRFGPSKVRVVVDSRGGATTGWISTALRSIGGVVRDLHTRQSATFHGLSPEPTLSSLGLLRQSVRKFSADFGVAVDGDGDRAVFVDEHGAPVPPEVIALCLLNSIARSNETLVASADLSHRLSKHAEVHWSKVGGLNVCDQMNASGAEIGAELSGHYYFKSEGFASDGILTSAVIAYVISSRKQPLSRYVHEFGDLNRLTVRIRGTSRRGVLKALSSLPFRHAPDSHPFCGGWLWRLKDGGSGYVRVSQTEPTIRLVCEGSPEALRAVVRELRLVPSLVGTSSVPMGLAYFRGWSEVEFRLRDDCI
jgi:phosphomannomutase/phosphoglucomutase